VTDDDMRTYVTGRFRQLGILTLGDAVTTPEGLTSLPAHRLPALAAIAGCLWLCPRPSAERNRAIGLSFAGRLLRELESYPGPKAALNDLQHTCACWEICCFEHVARRFIALLPHAEREYAWDSAAEEWALVDH
jgi:hypothetical protein